MFADGVEESMQQLIEIQITATSTFGEIRGIPDHLTRLPLVSRPGPTAAAAPASAATQVTDGSQDIKEQRVDAAFSEVVAPMTTSSATMLITGASSFVCSLLHCIEDLV